MRQFPFVVFEGLDGAGKTTLAQLFANRYRLSYYGSIPNDLLPLRPKVDATQVPNTTFQFYALCNVMRSHEYALQLNFSGVVADRYAFSTLAYHSLLIKQDLSHYFRVLQSEHSFLWPDVIVYVTASHEVICQRIANRCKEVPIQWYGDKVSLEGNLTESYKRVFALVDIPVVQIDTSDASPEQAHSILCNELHNLRKRKPDLRNLFQSIE